MNYMMKCGHSANATQNGKPVCVICAGINSGYNQVIESPDLTNRIAICPSCKKTVNSDLSLAFFEYKPYENFDRYYCGCKGWD